MALIKAILFDMDNTLLDRVKGCHDVYGKMLIDTGKFEDKVELEAAIQDCLLWDLNGTQSRELMSEKLKKKYDLDLPNSKIVEYWLKYISEFEKPYPETVDTLEYLKSKYKLGLVTNGGSENQWFKIKKSGIMDYFDEIVVSGDVKVSKPDPAIFKIMLDKLQISAEEAVFVGDNYSADVIGAYRSGIRPIWFCPDTYNLNYDGIERITNIADLKKMF